MARSFLYRRDAVNRCAYLRYSKSVNEILQDAKEGGKGVDHLYYCVDYYAVPAPIKVSDVHARYMRPSQFRIVSACLVIKRIICVLYIILLHERVVHVYHLFPTGTKGRRFASSIVRREDECSGAFLVNTQSLRVAGSKHLTLCHDGTFYLPLDGAMSTVNVAAVVVYLAKFRYLGLRARFAFVIYTGFRFDVFYRALRHKVGGAMFFCRRSFYLFRTS